MAFKLVVTNTFADFVVGQEITDAELVKKYPASHPSYVVRVMADEPAPKPDEPELTPMKPQPDA